MDTKTLFGADRRGLRLVVNLSADEVVEALDECEEIQRLAIAADGIFASEPVGDSLFLDDTDGRLALWKRPHLRRELGILAKRNAIYPDVLVVSVEPTPSGCEIDAAWEEHPRTQNIRLRYLFVGLVGPVAAVLGLATESDMMLSCLVLLGAGAYSLWRSVTLRRPPSDAARTLEAGLAGYARRRARAGPARTLGEASR